MSLKLPMEVITYEWHSEPSLLIVVHQFRAIQTQSEAGFLAMILLILSVK